LIGAVALDNVRAASNTLSYKEGLDTMTSAPNTAGKQRAGALMQQGRMQEAQSMLQAVIDAGYKGAVATSPGFPFSGYSTRSLEHIAGKSWLPL